MDMLKNTVVPRYSRFRLFVDDPNYTDKKFKYIRGFLDKEPVIRKDTISKILILFEDATSEAVANVPIVIRSLKFKFECEKAVQIYQELYTDIKRRVKQKSLKDYFTTKN